MFSRPSRRAPPAGRVKRSADPPGVAAGVVGRAGVAFLVFSGGLYDDYY